jgi:hypothetical protein
VRNCPLKLCGLAIPAEKSNTLTFKERLLCSKLSAHHCFQVTLLKDAKGNKEVNGINCR